MSSDERIRVMIVDDHSIVRVGQKQVLEQSGEFEVVGQSADGEEAVRVAAEVLPEVVVMDVMMPKKDGVEACREIMASESPQLHHGATSRQRHFRSVSARGRAVPQAPSDRRQLFLPVCVYYSCRLTSC